MTICLVLITIRPEGGKDVTEKEIPEVEVKVRIDQTDLDDTLKKLERIRDLMKEANSLAGELASSENPLLKDVQ